MKYAIVSAVAVILIALGFGVHNYAKVHTQTCTVISTDRSGTSGGTRVKTSDCGTLVVKRSWLHPSDPAKVYESIELGNRYNFRVFDGNLPFIHPTHTILKATLDTCKG